MTNHWVDLKNTDYALIIGSNAAENHPASMGWLHKAQDERGAKIIVVDPRFTRTASQADLYAPIRSGTDIAFFGGLMKYIMENELYHKDYVVNFTNAATLINPDSRTPPIWMVCSLVSTRREDGFGLRPDAPGPTRPTQTATSCATRPSRIPTVSFSHLKQALCRYDSGHGVCGLRVAPRTSCKEVYDVYAQSGAAGKDRLDPVCHGPDAAYRRLAERALHGHGPAACWGTSAGLAAA